MTDERKQRVGTLLRNLSARFEERKFTAWARFHPEELERFWKISDELDAACQNYLAWEPVSWDAVRDLSHDLYTAMR